MQLTPDNFAYLGMCLEGFFFGLYSGIFALHLQIHASRKEHDDRKQNIVFHTLWVLYVSSAALIAIHTANFVAGVINYDGSTTYNLDIAQIAVFACCDFIAQSILIHRCWVVWGRNIRVVTIPSILAFAYLVMWTASFGALFIGQRKINKTAWGITLALTSLTASMIVNALVTGLIIFKILEAFREIKSVTTSDEKFLGVTGGRKLRSVIFVIIESGMALFAIQLARLILSSLVLSTTAEVDAYDLIVGIHAMLNGITPTIILVRVSMGLSFHDEPSLVEAVDSLQFGADSSNPIAGMGRINQDGSFGIEHDDFNSIPDMVNISQESRDDDDQSEEIQMVDK